MGGRAEDNDLPASMKFSSVEAMEQTIPGMEVGLRAALPQLDAVLAG